MTEGGIASYTVSYTGGTIDDGVTVLVTVNANSGAGPNGAIQGTDFTDISTVLTFTNGVTARTVNVQTTDDTAVESAETYNVTIGLGTNHGTITDGTANTTIIDNDDTSPIGGAATATVYERGIEANGSFADGTLPGSNDENAGGSLGYSYQANPPHPTTPFVWSTSVTTTDGESPFGGVSLTSGGSPIVWSVSGGGLVLTGTVNGGPHNGEVVAVLTVTNSTTGTYTFEQRGAIDHPDQGANGTQVDGNDPLRLNFSYTLTDADNDTGNGTLQVTVNDNGPLATAQNASLTDPAAVDTNLMIVLDVSGSMEFDSGLTNLDRLEASLGAINELFEQYESLGDVKVQIVTFASGASTQNENGDGGLWLSIADAKEFLEGVVASGNTNFDAALLTAMTAYANAGKILESDPSPRPVQSVAYFVSDGDPTSSSTWPTIGSNLGDGIQPAEENVWEQFLRDNDINAFAIGIGTGITVSNLNPVAYDGVLEQERNGTQVSDLNDLQQTLVSTIQNQTTGSLGTMGADGGRVSQFTYGDSTFTYNGTTITRTSGTVSFTGVGNLLTIDAAAGSMAVNMATAVYTYTTDTGLTFPVAPEAFGYTLRDNDGDTASGNFQITVTHADSAPIVRDDNLMVISSHGSGFVVDDQWLLWNDTDKDGDTITKIGGDVTINTDSEGSFSYTGQSNSLTDTGIVFVDETNGSS
ncbi:MAG: VWA domain-containing protein, partial [Dongiaceae bacterium]